MKLAKLGTVAMSLWVSASAFAQGPNPNEVYINQISYAGTGCPAGSASGFVSADLKAFTLLFDSYVAEKGPGIPISQSRKNCNLAIDLRIPSGWQYSIYTQDTRGFMSLEPGVSAVQSNSFYFSDASNNRPVTLMSRWSGPRTGDYHVQDRVGIESVVWSRCGVNRALNVKTQIYLQGAGNRSGLITTDSIDGEFKLIYGMNWRRC